MGVVAGGRSAFAPACALGSIGDDPRLPFSVGIVKKNCVDCTREGFTNSTWPPRSRDCGHGAFGRLASAAQSPPNPCPTDRPRYSNFPRIAIIVIMIATNSFASATHDDRTFVPLHRRQSHQNDPLFE